MTHDPSLDEILDEAIGDLVGGEPLPSILARHSAYASALRPLLESAGDALNEAAAHGALQPLSDRGATILRAALYDQRDAERRERKPLIWRVLGARRLGNVLDQRMLWAPRRLAIASLSLPGIVIAAIAIAGTGGATAAALVATQPELRSRVADLTVDNLRLSSSTADGIGHAPTPATAPTLADATRVPTASLGFPPATPSVTDAERTPLTSSEPTRIPATDDADESGLDRDGNGGPSDARPGHSEDAPGQSDDAPGHSGDVHTPKPTKTPRADHPSQKDETNEAHTPSSGNGSGTQNAEPDDGHGPAQEDGSHGTGQGEH